MSTRHHDAIEARIKRLDASSKPIIGGVISQSGKGTSDFAKRLATMQGERLNTILPNFQFFTKLPKFANMW